MKARLRSRSPASLGGSAAAPAAASIRASSECGKDASSSTSRIRIGWASIAPDPTRLQATRGPTMEHSCKLEFRGKRSPL